MVPMMKKILLFLLFPLVAFAYPGISSEIEYEFTAYIKTPTNEGWEKLNVISNKTDGSSSLEFDSWVFDLLKARPLSLYEIYVGGDDRALLMQDHAFEYDFSAFNISPDRAKPEILPVYLGVLRAIESQSTGGYSKAKLARHKLFIGLTKGQLSQWKQEWTVSLSE
jgi:hypothetical protein